MGDTLGLVMLENGDDPANVTDESFERGARRIQRAVDSGQIRRFTGNDYAQPLAKGDLAAAIAWSGDIVQLLSSNPKLKWALPEKGGIIWTDNMLIPTGGSVPTASTYMNFVYDPKIAAQIAAYVAYVPPVKGAQDDAREDGSRRREEPAHLPADEVLAQMHQYDSTTLNNQDYIEQWQEVLGPRNVGEPMVPTRAPSFRHASQPTALGLSAGKAGLRPRPIPAHRPASPSTRALDGA